jgi:uncharacterized repeat protein (TIGR03803 family)
MPRQGGTGSEPHHRYNSQFAKAQTLTVLYTFSGGADGTSPFGLNRDSGNLYGITATGGKSNFGKVFKLDPTGKESVLHSFGEGTDNDGANPSSLILDSSGNLYGTTAGGGVSGSVGTVFKLVPLTNIRDRSSNDQSLRDGARVTRQRSWSG